MSDLTQDYVLRMEFMNVAMAQQRPSVLYRPQFIQDGDGWLCILGDLPTGVVGTGKTPCEAEEDFNRAWYGNKKLDTEESNPQEVEKI
jgi:hypothetical protein